MAWHVDLAACLPRKHYLVPCLQRVTVATVADLMIWQCVCLCSTLVQADNDAVKF